MKRFHKIYYNYVMDFSFPKHMSTFVSKHFKPDPNELKKLISDEMNTEHRIRPDDGVTNKNLQFV